MSSIGELATFYPVSGSFSSYATRFVDPSLGFTMGWLYYIMWALVSSVDVMVASNVLYYWDIFKFFSPLYLEFNLYHNCIFIKHLHGKSFWETEFWLSLVKVVTIIIFIIVGFLMIFGILGSHTYGFENYTKGEAPFVGGLSGFLGVLLVAGFSVGGTEVVAVTAGESDNPEKQCLKLLNKFLENFIILCIINWCYCSYHSLYRSIIIK